MRPISCKKLVMLPEAAPAPNNSQKLKYQSTSQKKISIPLIESERGKIRGINLCVGATLVSSKGIGSIDG